MSRADLLRRHAEACESTSAALRDAIAAAHAEGRLLAEVATGHLSLTWRPIVTYNPLSVSVIADVALRGPAHGSIVMRSTAFGWSIEVTARPPRGGEQRVAVSAQADLRVAVDEVIRRLNAAAVAAALASSPMLELLGGAALAAARRSHEEVSRSVSDWLEAMALILANRKVVHV